MVLTAFAKPERPHMTTKKIANISLKDKNIYLRFAPKPRMSIFVPEEQRKDSVLASCPAWVGRLREIIIGLNIPTVGDLLL